MMAVLASAGSGRSPASRRTPSWIATSTFSGSTPGRATKIRTASSVSSTSVGGSQLMPRWETCGGVNTSRCRRSARASICRASDHIQFRGSSLAMAAYIGRVTGMRIPRSSIAGQRLIDQVAQQVAVAQPRRGRLHHEHDEEALARIVPEIGAVGAAPVVVAGRTGQRVAPLLVAHREAQAEALAHARAGLE